MVKGERRERGTERGVRRMERGERGGKGREVEREDR